MKQWEPPRLMVLVRGKPEESILTACKGGAILTDPRGDFSNCTWVPTPPFSALCPNCNTVADS